MLVGYVNIIDGYLTQVQSLYSGKTSYQRFINPDADSAVFVFLIGALVIL